MGWVTGRPTMPFCRSTTISAVLGSSVVNGTEHPLEDRDLLGRARARERLAVIGQPLEQRDGLRQLVLFLRGQTRLERAGQPILAGRATFLGPFAAGIREREERLASVRRVRRAAHQPR